MATEIERDLISKRTVEGLRAARAKGKLLGRPKGPGRSRLDTHRDEIIALLKHGSTQVYIAKRCGTAIKKIQRMIHLGFITFSLLLFWFAAI